MIFKCLDISVNTLGSTVWKDWKLHHTSQALPRQGHPSKLSIRARSGFTTEAIERPTISLKELVAETGVKVHQSTISKALYTTGLYGRVSRKKAEFARKHQH